MVKRYIHVKYVVFVYDIEITIRNRGVLQERNMLFACRIIIRAQSFLQQNIVFLRYSSYCFKCYKRLLIFLLERGGGGVGGAYCKITFQRVVFGITLITYQRVVFGLALIFPWTTRIWFLNVGGSHYSLLKKHQNDDFMFR